MTSADYYAQGNALRREGRYAEAMNCYAEALRRDPSSPAKVAYEMLAAQFAFFCKDYYNP